MTDLFDSVATSTSSPRFGLTPLWPFVTLHQGEYQSRFHRRHVESQTTHHGTGHQSGASGCASVSKEFPEETLIWYRFNFVKMYIRPLAGGNSNIFWNLHPYLGKIPILTNICSNGLVQPPTRPASISSFPGLDEATLSDSTVSTIDISFQYHTYHISIRFPIHSSVLVNMDAIYDTVAVAITAPLLNCTHHSCFEDQIFAVNGETIHKTLGWRTASHLMYRSVKLLGTPRQLIYRT